MANALYNKGREGFMTGAINMTANDIRAILVDAGAYTVNLATHDFLDDIPSGARIAVSAAMTSKTVTDGIFDAADTTWTAVTGVQSEYVVIYQHTGTESTSRLIAFFDTATGLPVLPNGGNITVTWDNGTNRIFKL